MHEADRGVEGIECGWRGGEFGCVANGFEVVEIEPKACLILDCTVMLVLIANLSSCITI